MKTGRPTKFNEKIRDKIMYLAGAGRTDAQIAEAIGVTERTLNIWKTSKGGDFFQSLKEAKSCADELVEAALFQSAVGYIGKGVKTFVIGGKIVERVVEKQYPPNTTACIYWLKNRRPKEWRDKVGVEVEQITEMEF